jgi:hypothetical protein
MAKINPILGAFAGLGVVTTAALGLNSHSADADLAAGANLSAELRAEGGDVAASADAGADASAEADLPDNGDDLEASAYASAALSVDAEASDEDASASSHLAFTGDLFLSGY